LPKLYHLYKFRENQIHKHLELCTSVNKQMNILHLAQNCFQHTAKFYCFPFFHFLPVPNTNQSVRTQDNIHLLQIYNTLGNWLPNNHIILDFSKYSPNGMGSLFVLSTFYLKRNLPTSSAIFTNRNSLQKVNNLILL